MNSLYTLGIDTFYTFFNPNPNILTHIPFPSLVQCNIPAVRKESPVRKPGATDSKFSSRASGFCPSLPNGQVKFLGKRLEEIQITEACCKRETFGGLVRMISGLVQLTFCSYSLSKNHTQCPARSKHKKTLQTVV